MAARSGMSSLVSYLRQYGQAATDDVFYGVTYWTDDQLQSILDGQAMYGKVRLLPRDIDIKIFALDLPRHYWVEADTFTVYDSDDTVVATSATLNEEQRLLTFTSALEEDEYYYIQGTFYNMIVALAELWGQKAEQRSQFVDFKAGNNRMYMNQEWQHCVDREQYYRRRIAKRFPRTRKTRWAT